MLAFASFPAAWQEPEIMGINIESDSKEEPRPDSVKGMSYTITIDEDGEAIVLHQSDNMSPAFEALLNWLSNYFASHN